MSQVQHAAASTLQPSPHTPAQGGVRRTPNLRASFLRYAAAYKWGWERGNAHRPHTTTQKPAADPPCATTTTTTTATQHPHTTPQPPVPVSTEAFSTGIEVGDVVKKFKFSKLDLWSNSGKDSLFIGLAPSYGKLSRDSIKTLNDDVKIMIAVTTNVVAQTTPKDRTWEGIRAAMIQNPVAEATDAYVYGPKPLGRAFTTPPRPDDSSNPTPAQEAPSALEASLPEFPAHGSFPDQIAGWLREFPDQDALAEMRIDHEVLAAIVARTDESAIPAECLGTEYERRKTVLDITVLRHPDADHPHFKLYRICLTGLMYSNGNNVSSHGITATYHSQSFKPCTAVISRLPERMRQEAIRMADALFDTKTTVPTSLRL